MFLCEKRGSEEDHKPSSVIPIRLYSRDREDGHLSRTLITQDLKRPYPPRLSPARGGGKFEWALLSLPWERGLFGLAPGGVYLAARIAHGTGELLPRLFTLTLRNRHRYRSTGRYVFCGTFLVPKFYSTEFGDSPCYGPPCPAELGLSSPPDRPDFPGFRRSDHLFPFRFPPFPHNSLPNHLIEEITFPSQGARSERRVGFGLGDSTSYPDFPPNREYGCSGDTEQEHCFFEPR